MKTNLIPLALAAALAATGASAQSADGFARMLARADANGDGTVTRDEVIAARSRQFGRLDGNRDGYVDAAEIERAQRMIRRVASAADAAAGGGIDRMDTDGDGRVSRAEFAGRTAGFDLADANHDGRLTPDEIARIETTLQP